MTSTLMKLKKTIDRLLEAESATHEIALPEFPGYVVKSLEVILADKNEERAAARLAALKAKVNEASALAKQSVGAAEDIESQRINVMVFEEPDLTAKPAIEQEIAVTGAGANKGARRAAESPLQKAVEALKHELAGLQRALGEAAGEHGEAQPADKAANGAASAKTPAKSKEKGKPGQESADATAKQEDDDEDKGKRNGDAEKAGQDDEEKAKKPARPVAKAVAWPLDMNATIPGEEPVAKSSSDLDWGPDPDFGARGA